MDFISVPFRDGGETPHLTDEGSLVPKAPHGCISSLFESFGSGSFEFVSSFGFRLPLPKGYAQAVLWI